MSEDQYKDKARAHLERLRLLAKDKGLTEQAIADLTGWKQQNVNRLLSGKYIPRYDNYLRLLEVIEK